MDVGARRGRAHSAPATTQERRRRYRNLKDWVTLDEANLDINLYVKEGAVLSEDFRSSEKFIHSSMAHGIEAPRRRMIDPPDDPFT